MKIRQMNESKKTTKTFFKKLVEDLENIPYVNEKDEDLIVRFSAPDNKIYSLYGKVYQDGIYIETKNLRATIQDTSGNEINYAPTNYKWSGVQYSVHDMISSVITDMTLGGKMFPILYVNSFMKDLRNQCRKDVIAGMSKKCFIDFEEMPLFLLTDQIAFYHRNDTDELYSVNLNPPKVVGSDWVAESDLQSSINDIASGEEKFVYSNQFNSKEELLNAFEDD